MKYWLMMFLLLGGVSAQAELNKWTDVGGKVHYSDAPPPAAARVERVSIPNEKTSAPPAAKSLAELEADLKKKQQARGEAEKKVEQQQEESRAKQRNCELARSNLKSLEESPRIASYTANGERSYLDDVARAQRTEESRKAVSQFCN